MGFSRREYWSGLRCPPPGDLPYPGLNPCLLHWQMDSLTLAPQGSMFSLYTFFCNFSFALQYEHVRHSSCCKWLQLIHFSGIKYFIVWVLLTFVIHWVFSCVLLLQIVLLWTFFFSVYVLSAYVKKSLYSRDFQETCILDYNYYCFPVTQSCLTLWSHRLQHARLLCLSLFPGVCSNSCPLSWWCHPTNSSFVTPFSFCPQNVLQNISWLHPEAPKGGLVWVAPWAGFFKH